MAATKRLFRAAECQQFGALNVHDDPLGVAREPSHGIQSEPGASHDLGRQMARVQIPEIKAFLVLRDRKLISLVWPSAKIHQTGRERAQAIFIAHKPRIGQARRMKTKGVPVGPNRGPVHFAGLDEHDVLAAHYLREPHRRYAVIGSDVVRQIPWLQNLGQMLEDLWFVCFWIVFHSHYGSPITVMSWPHFGSHFICRLPFKTSRIYSIRSLKDPLGGVAIVHPAPSQPSLWLRGTTGQTDLPPTAVL